MMEKVIERVLVAARWILAPFYLGLVLALLVLLFKFGQELIHFVLSAPHLSEEDTILGALSVIDLTLMGSLVLIVMFSGYENFVSRIDATGHSDWPEWMTKVDFSGLKQKLLASIVAISAIQVLKAFMNLDAAFDPAKMGWLAGVHLVFVISTLLLALSDRWADGRSAE